MLVIWAWSFVIAYGVVGEGLVPSRWGQDGPGHEVVPPHSNSPEPLGIFVPDVVGIFVLPSGERGRDESGSDPCGICDRGSRAGGVVLPVS